MKILAEALKRYPCVPDTATSEEAAERESLHEGFVEVAYRVLTNNLDLIV